MRWCNTPLLPSTRKTTVIESRQNAVVYGLPPCTTCSTPSASTHPPYAIALFPLPCSGQVSRSLPTATTLVDTPISAQRYRQLTMQVLSLIASAMKLWDCWPSCCACCHCSPCFRRLRPSRWLHATQITAVTLPMPMALEIQPPCAICSWQPHCPTRPSSSPSPWHSADHHAAVRAIAGIQRFLRTTRHHRHKISFISRNNRACSFAPRISSASSS